MRTHKQIILDGGGSGPVARAVSSDTNTVNQWRRLSSIPAAYWRAVVDARLSTFEELAAAAEAKRIEAAASRQRTAA